MQSFTKIEIVWIADALDRLSRILDDHATELSDKGFSGLYQLKSEQYTDISRRLRAALAENSKRIEIK